MTVKELVDMLMPYYSENEDVDINIEINYITKDVKGIRLEVNDDKFGNTEIVIF